MLDRPRLIIAGLSGGAGKTMVSLGLARALARRGLAVQPFKKGPDYIDAAWLGLAAGTAASNLDPFLMSEAVLRGLFLEASQTADVSLIEGNRGLFDGLDVQGSASTAELARQLDAPVILAVNCSKTTRTVAALVLGCQAFEPGLRLAGVFLNQVAGARHEDILRRSLAAHCHVPVLGVLPRLDPNPIPERHMGLTSDREMDGLDDALDRIADILQRNADLDAVLAAARAAPPLAPPDRPLWPVSAPSAAAPRIGFIRDAALWFYYPENLEALRREGAELAELSLLSDAPWPELDGLYLGGGFPETQAERLAANVAVRARVRELSEAGLPIYAECGGLMYLCRNLIRDGAAYPMAGVFPVDTELCAKPQGLGYTEADVVADNPFFPVGTVLLGHEFHYSRCVDGPGRPFAPGEDGPRLALAMRRGRGLASGRDGLLAANTLASYNHIHALAAPGWAARFVAAARAWRAGRGAD